MTLQEVNEALTLMHEAADEDANIIFGSSSTRTCSDEVKITIIATGFQHRGAEVRRQAPAATHVPTRPAAAAPAETAALGPARASRATAPEPRPLAPTRPLKEPSLPLDEDQFDIPTFLRRQG